MTDQIARHLRKLPAVPMSWTPATTPPTEDEHVLAFFEHGGISEFSIAYYAGEEYGWFEIKGDNSEPCDAAPSHWMELPKTP